MSAKRTGLHLRVDEELPARLRKAAEERMVSINYLAGKILDEGLDNLIPVDELTLTRPR